MLVLKGNYFNLKRLFRTLFWVYWCTGELANQRYLSIIRFVYKEERQNAENLEIKGAAYEQYLTLTHLINVKVLYTSSNK